jgi:hypothetical protein
MKRPKSQCPLTPPGTKEKCPLQPPNPPRGGLGSIIVSRTDKRSWITIAITGFGALLLRYLRTVRERALRIQKPSAKPQARR